MSQRGVIIRFMLLRWVASQQQYSETKRGQGAPSFLRSVLYGVSATFIYLRPTSTAAEATQSDHSTHARNARTQPMHRSSTSSSLLLFVLQQQQCSARARARANIAFFPFQNPRRLRVRCFFLSEVQWSGVEWSGVEWRGRWSGQCNAHAPHRTSAFS